EQEVRDATDAGGSNDQPGLARSDEPDADGRLGEYQHTGRGQQQWWGKRCDPVEHRCQEIHPYSYYTGFAHHATVAARDAASLPLLRDATAYTRTCRARSALRAVESPWFCRSFDDRPTVEGWAVVKCRWRVRARVSRPWSADPAIDRPEPRERHAAPVAPNTPSEPATLRRCGRVRPRGRRDPPGVLRVRSCADHVRAGHVTLTTPAEYGGAGRVRRGGPGSFRPSGARPCR